MFRGINHNMSLTLQNINSNLHTRYQILADIIERYSDFQLEPADNKMLTEQKNLIEAERREYMLTSVSYISEFFSTPDEKRKDIYKRYTKFITMKNFVPTQTTIYNTIVGILDRYEIPDSEFAEMKKRYENAIVDVGSVEKIPNNCPLCGKLFKIEPMTSENVCVTCNYTEQLHGTVFVDEQFFYQDGPRSKHGRYDPSKHCKAWLDTIQALDSVNTDDWKEMIIDPLRQLIDRDKIARKELVTCKVIRGYLKELNLTPYNEYIPLIRKMTVGIEPPRLTNEETSAVITRFSQVIQLYLKEKQNPKCGIYYPYLLYKIIQNVLRHDKDKKRCRDILSYIHLQKTKTVINHDTVWQTICVQIPGLEYTPTDPSEITT